MQLATKISVRKLRSFQNPQIFKLRPNSKCIYLLVSTNNMRLLLFPILLSSNPIDLYMSIRNVSLLKRQLYTTSKVLQRTPQHPSSPLQHLSTKDHKTYKLEAFPASKPLQPHERSWANKMFARPATFIKSISQTEQAPETTLPEVRCLMLQTDSLTFYSTSRLRLWVVVTLG